MSGMLLWEEVLLDSAITVSVIGVPGLCVLFVCLFVCLFVTYLPMSPMFCFVKT